MALKKIVFIMLLMIPLAFALAGCDSNSSESANCIHEFGEWRETVPATCEKGGMKKRTCSLCGYVEPQIIDKLGHDYEETIVSAATCTEDGEKKLVCRNDPSHVKTEVIPATGHDWVMGAVIREATCTQKGLAASAQCKNCSETQQEVEIPALGHDFSGKAEITKQATCTQKGEKVIVCANGCGEKSTEEIPALEHDFSGTAEITKQATCTETGEKVIVCANGCGEKFKEEIPALGHLAADEGVVLAKPDCTNPGRKSFFCNRCQKTVEEQIPALGHDTSGAGNLSENATCSKGGKLIIDCPRCRLQTEVITPALGHLFPDEFTADIPATCDTSGHGIKKCMREGCEVVLAEKMLKSLGHIWDGGETRNSECGGTVTTYHCTREGCNGTKDECSYANNHQMGEYRSLNNGACLEGYLSVRECSVCGYRETMRTLSLLGHSWNNFYTLGLEPTETRDGYKYIACSVCGSEKPSSRVVFPKYTLGKTMTFEVNLCRSFMRQFYGEGTVHVYDGDQEVFSGKTEKQNVRFSLPAKDYRVKVTDLPNGYTSESFLLTPSNACMMVEIVGTFPDGEKPNDSKYSLGDPLYNLSFRDYDDKTYDINALLKQYKAIVLNFYYTTCTFCNQEFPTILQSIQEYGDEVLVVFVNGHGESKSAVMSHAEKYGINTQIIAQKFLLDEFQRDSEWGFPTTMVIDCEGTISEIFEGAFKGNEFSNLIKKYIAIADAAGWKKDLGIHYALPVADLSQKQKFL